MSLAVAAVQKEARRKHPSFPIKAELGTHTKKATFFGSTHGCFLRASCVLPSVASLTSRSVSLYLNKDRSKRCLLIMKWHENKWFKRISKYWLDWNSHSRIHCKGFPCNIYGRGLQESQRNPVCTPQMERLCMLCGNPVMSTDCRVNPMITIGFAKNL